MSLLCSRHTWSMNASPQRTTITEKHFFSTSLNVIAPQLFHFWLFSLNALEISTLRSWVKLYCLTVYQAFKERLSEAWTLLPTCLPVRAEGKLCLCFLQALLHHKTTLFEFSGILSLDRTSYSTEHHIVCEKNLSPLWSSSFLPNRLRQE